MTIINGKLVQIHTNVKYQTRIIKNSKHRKHMINAPIYVVHPKLGVTYTKTDSYVIFSKAGLNQQQFSYHTNFLFTLQVLSHRVFLSSSALDSKEKLYFSYIGWNQTLFRTIAGDL